MMAQAAGEADDIARTVCGAKLLAQSDILLRQLLL